MNNTISILIAMLLAMALASCEEKSLKDFFKGSSSSSEDMSSSSKKISSEDSLFAPDIDIEDEEEEDEDINKIASFASEVFAYKSFPFIENWYLDICGEAHDWNKFSSLDYFIDSHKKNGRKAFKSLFKRLYNKKEEYLSNGEFQHQIELIAKLIPYKTYVVNGWSAMVQQLLVAYDDLAASPSNFSRVYKIMKANSGNATQTYSQILEFVRDERLGAFILKRDVDTENYFYWTATEGNVNRSAVVWAYSFWGRRYNENPGSIESIASILRLLRDKYPAEANSEAWPKPIKAANANRETEKAVAVVKSSFTDSRDGKIYKTVKIGTQTWMAENLNYYVKDSKCYENKESNCIKYGRLYDFETAKKICPSSWHIPSNEEWQILVNFADGDNIAGHNLKAKSGWSSKGEKSGNGTDIFGFSAMPSGHAVLYSGNFFFHDVGETGYWWTSSLTRFGSYSLSISCQSGFIGGINNPPDGFWLSVRCLQD